MLNAWAAATEGLDLSEDIEMNDDGDGDAEMNSAVAKEYAGLTRCFEEFQPRFAQNEWTTQVLGSTY